MPYVTYRKHRNRSPLPQINFDDLYDNLNLNIPELRLMPPEEKPSFFTVYMTNTSESYQNLIRNYDTLKLYRGIESLFTRYGHMLRPDMMPYYHTFYIPKKTGGMRRIDAPNEELKHALSDITHFFEKTMSILTHDAAHAYTQTRSTITAMEKHQAANSKWFLKLDLKDFFPSHNHEYIMRTLGNIFPFNQLGEGHLEMLSTLIKLGLLDDKLPQGTPLSPYLTNLLMVPIDEELQHRLRSEHPGIRYTYTRYADDILISAGIKFKYLDIVQVLSEILVNNQTPFQIKHEKTHFGSSAGRNWNLGIMLNKDNNLTIGHKQNQRFRAAVFNFFTDYENNQPWSREDTRVLLGQISYYRAIEPDYVNQVITKYNQKFNKDLKTLANRVINQP